MYFLMFLDEVQFQIGFDLVVGSELMHVLCWIEM